MMKENKTIAAVVRAIALAVGLGVTSGCALLDHESVDEGSTHRRILANERARSFGMGEPSGLDSFRVSPGSISLP